MSLRVFHMLFIALSIVLSAGVGGWGVQSFLATGRSGSLALGVAFFALGLVLLLYGVRTFRRLRELGP